MTNNNQVNQQPVEDQKAADKGFWVNDKYGVLHHYNNYEEYIEALRADVD